MKYQGRIQRMSIALAIPAMALSVAASSPALAAVKVTSLHEAPDAPNVTIILGFGPNQVTACNENTNHETNDGGDIVEADQNCGVRVWFYRLPDQNGNAVCLNPNTNWFPEYWYPSFYISSNTAACG